MYIRTYVQGNPKSQAKAGWRSTEWMAQRMNQWMSGEWMNCNLFWICRQSAKKTWRLQATKTPGRQETPSIIWFTSLFFYYYYLFRSPFEKSSHERQNVDRMWGCVFFFFYLPALSLLCLSRSRLIILLKQISALKLITLMKLCLRLWLWPSFFTVYS